LIVKNDKASDESLRPFQRLRHKISSEGECQFGAVVETVSFQQQLIQQKVDGRVNNIKLLSSILKISSSRINSIHQWNMFWQL